MGIYAVPEAETLNYNTNLIGYCIYTLLGAVYFDMKKTEAYFIPHCDNETCDLGAFQYTCPHCNETVSDYEVWWKQDDIWSGKPEVFDCEKCDKSLTVEWDKDEYEYWVS